MSISMAVVPRRISSERMLLEIVADTYANLKSLSTDILITNQSDDGSVFNHREKRARAFFSAPENVRIEQGGRRGSATVTNGVERHHYVHFGMTPLYVRHPAKVPDALPGRFRPEFPHAGGITFLFDKIAERVVKAETLRLEYSGKNGETECQVLAVSYELPSHSGSSECGSPLYLWVNCRSRLITRMEFETTQRLPFQGETQTNKLILTYTGTIINERIAPNLFDFIPPGDSTSA